MSEKPKIVLIGGGGHCISVIDVIEQQKKYTIKGILEPNERDDEVLGYPILGDDSLIPKLVDENTFFLITVGQIKSYKTRLKLANILFKNKAKLATVISPRAYVSRYSVVSSGSVIMHDAIVNAKATIGKHSIINTKSNIEHGVIIGDFCHISTCAVVNGDSRIERGCFIGSNATISNNININSDSIISAGKFIK